jgi:hypothetical protein
VFAIGARNDFLAAIDARRCTRSIGPGVPALRKKRLRASPNAGAAIER